MWHRNILLGNTSRVKGFFFRLGIEPAFWYYVMAMVNKIFTALSVLIYVLALGLLTYGILVMLGKVQ
jgi:hypothetical protein